VTLCIPFLRYHCSLTFFCHDLELGINSVRDVESVNGLGRAASRLDLCI
jgi:hypothetical protein